MRAAQMQRLPLGTREAQIIRRLKNVLGLPVTKIALAFGRHKKIVHKILKPSFNPVIRGCKHILAKKDVLLIARTVRAMVKKAKARYEVTMAMVLKQCKIQASQSCVRKALLKHTSNFGDCGPNHS